MRDGAKDCEVRACGLTRRKERVEPGASARPEAGASVVGDPTPRLDEPPLPRPRGPAAFGRVLRYAPPEAPA
jgi:hypothetical protein